MYELFVHQKYFGILKKPLYNIPKVTRSNVLKWFKYDLIPWTILRNAKIEVL